MTPIQLVQDLLLSLGVLILILGIAYSQDAVVRTLCLETADGIRVTVKPTQPHYLPKEDITIYFEVVNRGPKPVYLVRKTSPEFFVEDGHFIIEVPQPLPLHHGEFDYEFYEILPGKTFKGTIQVPGEKVSSTDLWNFDVGFGFVRDVGGLNPIPKGNTDPAPLRSLLNSRITTVLLRGLTIKIG